MKSLLLIVVAFFAAPAAAFGEVSLTMREVPLHGERTLAAATPHLPTGSAPPAPIGGWFWSILRSGSITCVVAMKHS